MLLLLLGQQVHLVLMLHEGRLSFLIVLLDFSSQLVDTLHLVLQLLKIYFKHALLG